MQTKSLPYIEDYLEVIAGVVGFTYKNLLPVGVTLARYDIQIVHSMAAQTSQGTPLTDRQALLAHKLVVKYRRQLAINGLDLGVHEHNAVFRLPVRFVDRSRDIKLKDNLIYIRFPYDDTLVNELKQSAKDTPGSLRFDVASKMWVATVTEPRLMWLQHLVGKYNFEPDDQIVELIAQVVQAQQLGYKIELIASDTGLEIINAENSLIEYINEKLDGFGVDNLVRLIDNSSILGYTVSAELRQYAELKYSASVQNLLLNKDAHLPLSRPHALEDIVEYAELSHRWPIFVFENTSGGSSEKIKQDLLTVFKPEEILTVRAGQRKMPDVAGYRCVHLDHWSSSWDLHIPLLVTMTALMVGVKKIQIVQRSEKVVFGTEVVYNQD
jgi:hypothetical protein